MAERKQNDHPDKVTQELVEMTNSRIEVLTNLIKDIQARGIVRGPSDKHLRRTRSFTATAVKEATEETLDSLQTGDIIYLDHTETKSILTGDRVASRCGMQEQGSRQSFNMESYAFRILPMLKYRQQTELELFLKAKEEAALEASVNAIDEGPKREVEEHTLDIDADSSEDEDEKNEQLSERELAALKMETNMRERVLTEEKQNNETIEAIIQGHNKVKIRYGMPIQLMHMMSGMFITMCQQTAPYDPECRAVTLASGSPSGYFKFVPRFKAQIDGSLIYYGDSMMVESVPQRENYLHVSPVAYDLLPSFGRDSLPRCLRTGRTLEINLSPTSSTFKCTRMGRFSPEECASLSSGSAFRLFHNMSSSFVAASANAEKNIGVDIGMRTWTAEDGSNQRSLPPHIPYLKKLIGKDGRTPDPSDPANQNVKSLWCFEHASRGMISTTEWEQGVRIRHVASGKYLAIDTWAPLFEGDNEGTSETWYATRMVDDADGEDADSYDNGLVLAEPESMIFYFTPTGANSGTAIPNQDIGVRLEHRFINSDGEAEVVYMHNTEELKPSRERLDFSGKPAPPTRNYHLVFCTLRSVQDSLNLVLASEEELKEVDFVKAHLPSIQQYNYAVLNPTINLLERDYKLLPKLFLSIIYLQIKGSKTLPDRDWLAVANSMLPLAFSNLFSGVMNAKAQGLCRDLKLLDAMYVATLAPYKRTSPKHPFDDPAHKDEMNNIKALQKFTHVVLQLMMKHNAASQAYFGDGRLDTNELYMDNMMSQLEDPLGSAVTLSQLLNSSSDLMARYASADLVDKFADMIFRLGPQPRLISFFSSVCSVNGEPIKANQEMILRQVWIKEDVRQKVMLECFTASEKERPINKPYPPIASLGGKSKNKVNGRYSASELAKFPPDYLGKEVAESAEFFPPVYVSWVGSATWRKDDALFLGPEDLGHPSLEYQPGTMNRQAVRIEDLCWVLDPEYLCKPITGRSWDKVKNEMDNNAAKQSRFSLQVQLASYLVGEIDLLGLMCNGRSSNCISWLEKTFSYTMLVSLATNPYLPPIMRAKWTSFVKSLYLDRYPQLPLMGKPQLPEQLWVYKLEEKNQASDDLPLIRHNLRLDDVASLPSFCITPQHILHGNPDPFYGFPGHTKFYLLRYFGNNFLKTQGGLLVHEDKLVNELTITVVEIVQGLLTYGFQSTIEKISELVPLIVSLLDGRSDPEKLVTVKGKKSMPVGFNPPELRYRLTPESSVVTAVKVAAIRVLMDVANLRANFRLGKLLENFKKMNLSPREQLELKKHHCYMVAGKEMSYSGFLVHRLFEEFELLFEHGDGARMDLDSLSGIETNNVLLDCLMYEDDALFESALQLMERGFGQRIKLLNALKEVTLQQSEKIVVFGNVSSMIARINHLGSLLLSSEVWGISNRISGGFNAESFAEVLETIALTKKILVTEPNVLGDTADVAIGGSYKESVPHHQDMLRALNLHTIMGNGLSIEYNLSFFGSICSSEDKLESRRMLLKVQREAVATLELFVRKNPKNQRLVFDHLPSLRKLMGPLRIPPLPEGFSRAHQEELLRQGESMNTELVIIECIRGNAAICAENIPRDLVEQFAEILNAQPDPSVSPLLEFFSLLCEPVSADESDDHNQQLVSDALLLPQFENIKASIHAALKVPGSEGIVCASPERIVEVLCRAIGHHNITSATRLMAAGMTMEHVLNALDKTSETKPENYNYIEDKVCVNLIRLLALQMQVLVVDPKLYRQTKTWTLVAVTGRSIVKAYVSAGYDEKRGNQGRDPYYFLILAVLKITLNVISGARSLGLIEYETMFSKQLTGYQHSNSIADLCLKIHHTDGATNGNETTQPTSFVDEMDDLAVEILTLLDPALIAKEEEEARLRKQNIEESEKFIETFQILSSLKEEPVDISSINDSVAPVEMLSHFTDALVNNPHVKNKIMKRRFTFVGLMEAAYDHTGPNRPGINKRKRAFPTPYAIPVTWEQLVARMVKYVKAHNYDQDETHLIRIFNVLMAHLLKARSAEDGSIYDIDEIDDPDLRQQKIDEVAVLQNILDDKGVTSVVLTAIATHVAGTEGSCSDVATGLLQELVRFGNTKVQDAVLKYMQVVDKDGHVMDFMSVRLDGALSIVQDRMERSAIAFESMSAHQRSEYGEATQTLELFSFLCEGHHLQMQDWLREQPLRANSVNIVEGVVNLLLMMSERASTLTRMEDVEVTLLTDCALCLSEMLQGPCGENQLIVTRNPVFLNGLNNILSSKFHDRVDSGRRVGAKAAVLNLLAAALEGRTDQVIHRYIAAELAPLSFERVRTFLGLGAVEYPDVVEHALVDLANIYDELTVLPGYSFELGGLTETRLKKMGKDLMDKKVAHVEVCWHGIIDSVSFRLPDEAPYLSSETKQLFMENVNLSTAEKRMKELFENMPKFVAEMERIKYLASTSRVYSMISHNIESIKWFVYAMVVLLNLNILMVTFGKNSREKGYGYYDISDMVTKTGDKWLSIYISVSLSVLILLGYLLIMVFRCITEIPILIQQVDNRIEEIMMSEDKADIKFRDPSVFVTFGVGCIFSVLFIILHYDNYYNGKLSRDDLNLYLFVIFGLNLPWALSCVRRYILFPDNSAARLYSLTYDIVVANSYLRNNILIIAFTILGFYRNEYFSLILLDILNNSIRLQKIIMCVVDPGRQLLMIMMLCVITSIIYAHFGLHYFEESFTATGKDGEHECHSAISCFWLILYRAIPATKLGGVMNASSNTQMDGKPDFMLRILFELSFFVWVGALLFEMVTGLMIDTFTKLRQATNARQSILKNQGFVNGITRAQFDDMGLPNSANFDDLNAKEQHPWNYVYFSYYLSMKNPMEYNGVESFVKNCIDNEDHKWLPNRTSFKIQHAQKAVPVIVKKKKKPEILTSIEMGILDLRREVVDLSSRLAEINEKDDTQSVR